MFRKITLFGVLLALIVVVLGATLRLSGTGTESFSADNSLFQNLLADSHLYPSIGLTIVVSLLGLLAWREEQHRVTALSTAFSVLVLLVAQGYLGLWTVATHAPILVAGHLLLGMITLWCLFWLYLRVNPLVVKKASGGSLLAGFAMLVLFLQIALGAWVSVNQAAFACSHFPLCNEHWWPIADYEHAFSLDGVFTLPAQIAIVWLHRLVAVVCFIVLSLVMLSATSANKSKAISKAGLVLSALLFIEIGLGVIGFRLAMPLWVAVAHNVVAALLMLPLISIVFYSRYGFVAVPKPKPIAEEKRQPVIDSSIPLTPVEKFVEAPYIEPEPESLYLRLKSQLKRTRSGLGGVLANLSIGQKGLGDDLLGEIEANLLMADLGVDATSAIINRLTQRLEKHQLNDSETLIATLKQELLSILKPCSEPLHIPKQDKPFVILVVGVNGAGKTTTIGKLAKRLQAQGHSVMLAAGDTFRAAAVEQLQVWGERNHIPVVAQHTGADSASVIYDAVQSAQAKGVNVLIADTAGRLQTKSNLMDELKKVKRIIGKLDDTAPHEVLLVLDAGTGQNALSQAKLFNEAVALTGLVLTKLDGTAKGGVIFALAKHSSIPIRYIGIGEGIDDLQDFNAELFVDALFVKD
ncbi:MAG: signal recognition particle-docking protein FtsY [Methylococcaceae bacterium]|nr:signal recognition particle-docking protein FtsY [Methylococcaceae bacterium]MDD1615537.1 signal recognition particle-docking protein FtsY [Methylococcaceae bacterium]OYV20080.1 MAG: fused signal recognition particle receptor [Methylococcaceae bacterium NSP1-2]